LAGLRKRQARSRHTIPNNRATTHVPSAQPIAMKNPHTNQTNNALAEITGTIRHPPFDLAELFLVQAPVQYEATAQGIAAGCDARPALYSAGSPLSV
jgi:hypothetical protein